MKRKERGRQVYKAKSFQVPLGILCSAQSSQDSVPVPCSSSQCAALLKYNHFPPQPTPATLTFSAVRTDCG